MMFSVIGFKNRTIYSSYKYEYDFFYDYDSYNVTKIHTFRFICNCILADILYKNLILWVNCLLWIFFKKHKYLETIMLIKKVCRLWQKAYIIRKGHVKTLVKFLLVHNELAYYHDSSSNCTFFTILQ